MRRHHAGEVGRRVEGPLNVYAKLCAATLLAAVALPTPARAAPMGPGTEAISVMILEADVANDHAAKTMTDALRAQVHDAAEYTLNAEALPLVATAYQVKCSLKALRAPLSDASDLAFDGVCLKKIAAHLGVKRFFWGYVYTEGGKPAVRLHFWQQGEADRSMTMPFEPDTRNAIAERLYRKLAIPEKVGDVTLLGEPRLAGELYVDGRTQGPYVPRAEIALLGGDHTIEVREGAKLVADGRVHVVPGVRSVLSLVAPEPPSAPPPSAPVPVEPPRPGGDPRPFLGWVAVGVGAASLAVGVVSTLRVKGIDDDLASDPAYVAYRRGVPGQDVCDAAERGAVSQQPGAASPSKVDGQCSTASTSRTLQYVFYAAGGAMASFGAYLLLTPSGRAAADKGGTATAGWRWAPELRPGGAGLTLGGRF
jgi:hypothetical protein